MGKGKHLGAPKQLPQSLNFAKVLPRFSARLCALVGCGSDRVVLFLGRFSETLVQKTQKVWCAIIGLRAKLCLTT